MTSPQLPAEPQPDPDAPSSAPSKPDKWATNFTRLIQTVGLGMVIFQQASYKSDPWLLLVAIAMMIGGTGLQLILRGLSNVTGGPPV
jgi:hypothetical protein